MLSLCMCNLLENALKYTSKTSVAEIEFGTKDSTDKIIYYIKDNGAGFDMKHVNKLFQPFSRLHSVKEFPGTGVGLAIAHRAIARHGGKIWAESKPGEGATFFFTIGS